jgi:hypothetical protein
MSNDTMLTLSTHTASGNLVFKANDHTVYVCKEAMHGAEMWKSNHGGFLNTAGKLSTKNNGFELKHTACQNCGKQTNCPICRCTDASLETDFQTHMFGIDTKKIGKMIGDKIKSLTHNTEEGRLKLIADIKRIFELADNIAAINTFCEVELSPEHWKFAQAQQLTKHLEPAAGKS